MNYALKFYSYNIASVLITVNRLGVLVLGVSKIVRAVKITGKPLFSMTNNLYSTKIIKKLWLFLS